MYSDWAKKSKTDKQLVYKALLSLYKIGQSLKGKDFNAVLELLTQHPDAENKIGVGIKDLLVDNDGYGGKCFHLVRHDGTKENFSYLKCLGYKQNIIHESNTPQETTQKPIKKEVSAMASESKQAAQTKQPQQNKQPQPPTSAPTPKKKSFFQRIQDECEDGNNRMVFQLKYGIIVEGVVADEESGFVKIVDAVITAKNSISKVKWFYTDRNQIGHFHPVTTDIEIVEQKLS